MAIRKIFKEGDAVLRKQTRPVKQFNAHLEELVDDMLETMVADHGVGLAAPQVGVLRRLFVMNVDDERGDLVLVNPEIVEASGEQNSIEGCLSLPGLFGYVTRPQKITIRYQDVTGKEQEMEFTDFAATCACHELDHLEGVLFRDRVEGALFRVNQEGVPYETEAGEPLPSRSESQ